MAKKKRKRRRLRKSVRLGCLGIVMAIVAVTGWNLWRKYGGTLRHDTAKAEADKVETIPLDGKVTEDLLRVIDGERMLDTATIAVSVVDLTAGQSVVQWHDRELKAPASCMKLLTAITAMQRLGTQHRLVVEGSMVGEVTDGTLCGAVLIEADDDPLVESLLPLVKALKDEGVRRIEGGVVLSMMRDDTLKAHPTAMVWDIPYHKVPILLKGRERVERELSALLRSQGITLRRNPLYVPDGLTDDGETAAFRVAFNSCKLKARTFYTHETPLVDILCPMLIFSSNIKADALSYHMDHAFDHLLGHRKVEKSLMEQFIDEDMRYGEPERSLFVINDGSGLSPDNRLTAHFLTALLAHAWKDGDMRDVLIDHALATPGDDTRRGSLKYRMSAQKYRGRIFCKTGTLVTRGASSLSGYAKSSNGHWYAFSILNEDSPIAESRMFQDRVCQALVQ